MRNEPEKDHFVDRILTAGGRVMLAVSLQEAGMVQAGRFGDGAALDLLAGSLGLPLLFKGMTLVGPI